MSSNAPQDGAAKIGKKEFCRACGRFATGITVATVLDPQGTPHGMTVNSFTSVSLDPPLVLIAVGHAASAIDLFRENKHFAINVLREGQRSLSDHFARKGHDRFEDVEWVPGSTGVPLIPGVLATIECARIQTVTAGDHDILIAEVLHTHIDDGNPLIYFASDYCGLK